MAVDMSADALPIIVIIGVAIGIGVDALVDVNTNVLAGGVMTALEFAISEALKEYSC